MVTTGLALNTSSTMGSSYENSNESISDIINSSDSILSEQNKILSQQNNQLNNKKIRNLIQLNAINAKKNIINTRARMLQIAHENNIYKQKIIYTLISFVFAVLIVILVIYVYYVRHR